MRRCSIEGCGKPHKAHGLCDTHYRRWLHRDGYPKREYHPLYSVWLDMKARCYRESRKDFHHYGGRGITVCARWRKNFWAFVADMGERPTPQHTIERINNDGNYEPDNCCWATRAEQNINTRTNRNLTLAGRTQPILHWARELGIDPATLRYRLRHWPIEKALSQPKQW